MLILIIIISHDNGNNKNNEEQHAGTGQGITYDCIMNITGILLHLLCISNHVSSGYSSHGFPPGVIFRNSTL